jgi:hypothetical protein
MNRTEIDHELFMVLRKRIPPFKIETFHKKTLIEISNLYLKHSPSSYQEDASLRIGAVSDDTHKKENREITSRVLGSINNQNVVMVEIVNLLEGELK